MGEDVTVAKTLTIFLAADVSKLNRQLKSAQSDLNIFSNGIGGVAGKLSNLMGPALIGATAAAGALAVKLGVDGVKAALDDEASLAKLATTLQNVGLAHSTTEIDNYIDSLEQSVGFLGDLRPAYDRLIRSTGDAAEANRALSIALDVAAGTGKDVDAVVQALGRAYDGNTAGLSRLGAGIDSATLKTGDMQLITAKLAETFGGQATVQAGTLQGQLQQLQRATEQVTEAFGRGFLEALGDTSDGTSDLVSSLEDLEPQMEKIGQTAGDVTTALVKGTAAFLDFNDEVGSLTDRAIARFSISLSRNADALGLITDEMGAADEAAYQLYLTENNLIPATESFTSATVQSAIALGTTTKRLAELNAEAQSTYRSFIAFATVTANTTRLTADQAERAATATTRVNGLSNSLNTYTGSSRAAATATTVTTDKFGEQEAALQGLNSQLQQQTRDLESATGAIATYAQGVADQITRGFDLSAGLTITDGQANAAEWLSGVDAEVAKYQWFGNVLAEIQRQGGPELRDYFASLGADVGGEMGQAAIDGGLVPQLASKLLEVQAAAFSVGQAMVPEFLLAGEESALEFVNGTVKQIEKEEKRLRQIGKNIGKPIGANIKAEIAQAVAEAIRAAEASRTAALAEISAREAATTASAVEQATAQSLARLIRNSDNRAGRNVQPVLA
jgi:hypothetical protein